MQITIANNNEPRMTGSDLFFFDTDTLSVIANLGATSWEESSLSRAAWVQQSKQDDIARRQAREMTAKFHQAVRTEFGLSPLQAVTREHVRKLMRNSIGCPWTITF